MHDKIYFLPLTHRENPSSITRKLKILFDQSGAGSQFQRGVYVAVKTHFGERGNMTYLHPVLVKVVVDKLKQDGTIPFLTETSTLYRGKRSNSIEHMELAFEHGFGFEKMGIPLIMADGLFGDAELLVDIQGRHFTQVRIAREVSRAQGLMVLSHFKGHMIAGFGGAFKNIGMGLASRKGKLAQHSVMSPEINSVKCTACGVCLKWCPQDTIEMVEGKAFILKENCIGCGECLAVCTYGAVRFDWGRDSGSLQEMIVEYSTGILKMVNNRAFFMNFLINITRDCDCGHGGNLVSDDIGIVAGHNILAVDKASCDIFRSVSGKSIREAAYPHINFNTQFEHAVRMGLGTLEYELEQLII
jgi:uncharacterized Fe-S center protein